MSQRSRDEKKRKVLRLYKAKHRKKAGLRKVYSLATLHKASYDSLSELLEALADAPSEQPIMSGTLRLWLLQRLRKGSRGLGQFPLWTTRNEALTSVSTEREVAENICRRLNSERLERGVAPEVLAAKKKASLKFLGDPLLGRLAAVNPGKFRAYSVSVDPIKNVCGVGLGRDGGHVRLYVNRKLPDRLVPEAFRLPDNIDGVPVEVVETGPFHVLAGSGGTARQRPVQPGYSVGAHAMHQQVLTAGTIAAIVTVDGDEQNRFLLSNSHVIAAGLPVGSPIFQPAIYHSGDPSTDAVAVLHKEWPIDPLGDNEVDCALGQITDTASVIPLMRLFGQLASGDPAAAVKQMEVVKIGCETDQTSGTIDDIDADVNVSFPSGTVSFVGQILVEPHPDNMHGAFAVEGDSGSLVMSPESRQPVGLLFGASQHGYGLANHLQAVLDRLKVKILV